MFRPAAATVRRSRNWPRTWGGRWEVSGCKVRRPWRITSVSCTPGIRPLWFAQRVGDWRGACRPGGAWRAPGVFLAPAVMPLASLRAEFIPPPRGRRCCLTDPVRRGKGKQSGAWRSALLELLGDAAAPAPEGRVVLRTEDVRRGGRASDDGRRREARTSLREGAPVQRRSGQSGREMARSCCRAFARFAPAGDPERCASGSAAEPRSGLAARSARA
jgi:hypothetical protein